MDRIADDTAAAVERFGPLVLKLAWRILPDAEEARDIFQETFLRFHAARCQGEEIAQPQAWLCRTAANQACKRLRQRRREVRIEEGTDIAGPDDGKEKEQEMLMARVRQLVAELPDRQREVFALRNFAALSFAQIGAQFGCSEEAARANEYKALKKIRAWLGDGWRE